MLMQLPHPLQLVADHQTLPTQAVRHPLLLRNREIAALARSERRSRCCSAIQAATVIINSLAAITNAAGSRLQSSAPN
jgi:hypothetical protein